MEAATNGDALAINLTRIRMIFTMIITTVLPA